MKTLYLAFGPFEVPLEVSARRVDRLQVRKRAPFWNLLEEELDGLSTAKGCYIFAMRAGKGATPWYVGQAGGLNGFQQEIFTPHKLVHYNHVLLKKGTPLLHLLARCTPRRKLSKQKEPADLWWVENQLIAHAVQKNPDLCNTRDTSFLKSVAIQGLTKGFGSGNHGADVRALKSVLGV